MIFIPAYSVPGEWQGTVIINKFDPSGAYLGQYVADVAMVSDPTETLWDVQFEVSYEDGAAYLEYGSPTFELGTPRDLQGPLEPAISSVRKPQFQKASFTTQAPFGGPPGGLTLRAWRSPSVRWVMKCTTVGTGGAAVRCGIGSLFTGGAAFAPCMGATAGGVFTVCTLTAIFG